MAEIPIAHQIEYLQKEITKTRSVLTYTDDPVTLSWLNESLAVLESVLDTVENAGMARCSSCGKPQARENTFFCFSCIPFDDGK
jgi:hypothetical protein